MHLDLRLAGPQLAEQGADLLPVALRRGGRTLGGALSWEKPAPLAPFPPESPFAGLDVPKDVTVSRQVLAEPALDLGSKTWARLTDGTPIVTAEQRGKGWLVLVHTTANPGGEIRGQIVIPEPAGMALLALAGGCAFLRRRRA